MMDEYSNVQTDQITEIFKRAMNAAAHKKLDNRGEFAWNVLAEVVWELERNRAIWFDVRLTLHYLANKHRQISFSERR